MLGQGAREQRAEGDQAPVQQVDAHDATPHVAMAELRRAFKPERLDVVEHRRGIVESGPEPELSVV